MGRGFVIAAPNSGSGKTTIARGLMALFARKGYRVQPFKCGLSMCVNCLISMAAMPMCALSRA